MHSLPVLSHCLGCCTLHTAALLASKIVYGRQLCTQRHCKLWKGRAVVRHLEAYDRYQQRKIMVPHLLIREPFRIHLRQNTNSPWDQKPPLSMTCLNLAFLLNRIVCMFIRTLRKTFACFLLALFHSTSPLSLMIDLEKDKGGAAGRLYDFSRHA